MRAIRKELTVFDTFGNKTVKMIQQTSNGQVDFLCTTDTNIRPNRLGSKCK